VLLFASPNDLQQTGHPVLLLDRRHGGTQRFLLPVLFMPPADRRRQRAQRGRRLAQALVQLLGDPLEFLAEFTQHIPPKGAHLIRYYGFYSNKARGMRRKAAEAAAAADSPAEATPVPPRSRASQTWAMLIKRVYEIDPLACPCCIADYLCG
jgi:hypothetical protein